LSSSDQWLVLGRVVRSRGRTGEVIVDAPGVAPDRLTSGGEFHLFKADAPLLDAPVAVENSWDHQGKLIVKFAGVNSITEAEALRGVEIRIRQGERAPLSDDEVYLADLVGCDVFDQSGDRIGKVEDWQDSAGPILLEVVDEQGIEILVPFARSICVNIDAAGKRIDVVLPDGLKDLNRP
jgi:16S rRNA processing protein RimM